VVSFRLRSTLHMHHSNQCAIPKAIRDDNDIASSKIDLKISSSLIFLRALPMIKAMDVYDAVHATAATTYSFGKILKSNFGPLRNEHPKRWTWSGGLAGIAFGGLVPLATRTLVEAVRFTT
jgi:hypothetical protein